PREMVLAPLHQSCPGIGKDELPGYEQNQNIYEARQVLEEAAAFNIAHMRRSRPACEWAISGACRGSCHCRLPRRHGHAFYGNGSMRACSLAVTKTARTHANASNRNTFRKVRFALGRCRVVKRDIVEFGGNASWWSRPRLTLAGGTA